MQEVTPKVRISRLKYELQDGEWNEDAMLAVDVKNGKQKKVPVTKFAKAGETAEAIENLAQSVQDNGSDILSLQQTKVNKAYVAPTKNEVDAQTGDIFFDEETGVLKKCVYNTPTSELHVDTNVANELKQRVSRGELTKDLGDAMITLQTEEVGNVEILAKKKNGDVVKVDGNDVAKASAGTDQIHNLTQTATEAGLKSGNYFVLDGAEGTKKLPAEAVAARNDKNIRCFVIFDNPEYVYAIVDAEGKFIFGIKNDGKIEWADGIPTPVKEGFSEKVDAEVGKSIIDKVTADASSSADNPEYLKIILDRALNVIEGIDNNGRHIFKTEVVFDGGVDWSAKNLTDLENALKNNGFSSGQGDWSDKKSLVIPKPKIAIINFSNINAMPSTKSDDLHSVMQFWDLAGNYFKKNVVLNAQGNSSMMFPKKNLAIDICNDEWVGDDTFNVKFGSWVAQDSFHIKAYYTDFFRGVGCVGYSIYEDVVKSRGMFDDRAWKKALVDEDAVPTYADGLVQDDLQQRIDDGALCHPDGFPCLVYLNEQFYGIYAFQLKKHRDNYRMDKSNKKHIHLDGEFTTSFWNGQVDWTMFEVRNPKIKTDKAGNPYDGDNPTEIPEGETHTAITLFASRLNEIKAAATDEEKRELVEKYFDVDNLIDYQIFSDFVINGDGFAKNWQWTTWDGVKWFVNPYDLDAILGSSSQGRAPGKPITHHCGISSSSVNQPTALLPLLYNAKLEERYAEVRKFVTAENIIAHVNEWVKTIGYDNFKAEYKKWTECPCNKSMTINENNWELVIGEDGKPLISLSSANLWKKTTAYNVGDTCVCNVIISDVAQDNKGWWYTFRCVQSCTGVQPADFTHADSSWRMAKFVKAQIENMDNLYNYIGE